MKKYLNIILLLVFVGAVVFKFKDQIFPQAPCAEPIPYLLFIFDEKFNISKEYFLSALADAEKIWEKPFGKELFTYAPEDFSDNVLKINLIYDYRQQATSKLASLGIVVKNTRTSYDSLKAKFTELKTEYEKEKSIFNTQVEAFNQTKLAHENDVKYWNKKGGAPKKEYDKLETMHLALQDESKKLQTMQIFLNEKADEINALVVMLNRLASSLNLSVEKYNTINVTRGESFEEGVYTSDDSNRKIDIYEFSSQEKLVRVLAHELGHALGLEHVDDPKAIMYKLNKDNNETLTAADLEALKIQCGKK